MPSQSTDSALVQLTSPTGRLVALFVLLLVAAGVLGFGDLLAAPIRLVAVAIGLWLLSRLVRAAERLADAHERVAGSAAGGAAAGRPVAPPGDDDRADPTPGGARRSGR